MSRLALGDDAAITPDLEPQFVEKIVLGRLATQLDASVVGETLAQCLTELEQPYQRCVGVTGAHPLDRAGER